MSTNNDYIKEFTAPWELRRGMDDMLLSSHYHIYFRCDIQSLQTVLSSKTTTGISDVLNKSVLIDTNFAIAFQLKGHIWSTLMLGENCEDILDQEFLARISILHNLQIITLRVSEVAWIVEYTVFDNGNVIEYFYGSQEDYGMPETQFSTTRYQINVVEEEPESLQVVYFYKTGNNINLPSNSTICTFPSERFKYYDLYAPPITIEYFLDCQGVQLGGVYQLKNSGMSMTTYIGETLTTYPNFLRVDFYRFL